MNNLFQRGQRLVQWLGPVRARLIFVLLAVTGLGSLLLNAVAGNMTNGPTAPTTQHWVNAIQSALLLLFVFGAFMVVLSRLPVIERRRTVIIFVPPLFAVLLSILLPALWLLFLPVGIGWIFVAYVASRGRIQREYSAAIKHMRKGEYDDAIVVMSDLIKAEPDVAEHRHFRAELYRLTGKGYRARDDYHKVIELLPESGIGYNGLSEVYLQDGDYETALGYAQKAAELEPGEWVAPYNLGMIEDRLARASDAIRHLQQALAAGIPDSRHRLLTHLWLLRAHVRLGDSARAASDLTALKRERTGLNEWKIVFESPEADVLREVLQADVTLCEQLVSGEIAPTEVLNPVQTEPSA